VRMPPSISTPVPKPYKELLQFNLCRVARPATGIDTQGGET
jgi:hypothetical protein